jgi:hypothetical protein
MFTAFSLLALAWALIARARCAMDQVLQARAEMADVSRTREVQVQVSRAHGQYRPRACSCPRALHGAPYVEAM